MTIPFPITQNGMFLIELGAELLMKLKYQVRKTENKNTYE
jgi:hypothetical protein